jgi:fringe protein
LSRALANKMVPVAGGGKFESVGDKIRLPDDVTMGYIAEHVLGTTLTVVPEFHSHLEPQRFLSEKNIEDQISFSYSKYGGEMNVIDLEGGFDKAEDPTR